MVCLEPGDAGDAGNQGRQTLDVDAMPETVARQMYEGQAPHDMYIGEIVEIIR